jgi:plastin-1
VRFRPLHRGYPVVCDNDVPRRSSALHTEVPGRVDKATVLQALQGRGESYDRARETLKHVSVDASGKVELEDWVEVCHPPVSRDFTFHDSRNPHPIAQC